MAKSVKYSAKVSVLIRVFFVEGIPKGSLSGQVLDKVGP